MKQLFYTYHLLRITFGVLFILVGSDKFFNILVNWQQFLGTIANAILFISPSTFLACFGALQIIIGIGFFTRYVILASYTALALLLLIFVNLLSVDSSVVVITHDALMIILLIIGIKLHSIVKKGIEE